MEYCINDLSTTARLLKLEPASVVKTMRNTWHCCTPAQVTAEIHAWCAATFSNPGFSLLTFDTRWDYDRNRNAFVFAHLEDAEMFMLRWS